MEGCPVEGGPNNSRSPDGATDSRTTTAGSFLALCYHLVIGAKDRRPLLTSEVAPRIHDYLGGIMRGKNGIPIILGVFDAADRRRRSPICSAGATSADLIEP